MTIADVTYNVKMIWNTIKNIEKHLLQKQYSKPFLDRVTRINIDEIPVLKGDTHMTVVLDLDSGCILSLAVNQPLITAYYLKEELILLWLQDDIDKARQFLASWIKKAYETGLLKLRDFTKTLVYQYTAVLDWSSIGYQQESLMASITR